MPQLLHDVSANQGQKPFVHFTHVVDDHRLVKRVNEQVGEALHWVLRTGRQQTGVGAAAAHEQCMGIRCTNVVQVAACAPARKHGAPAGAQCSALAWMPMHTGPQQLQQTASARLVTNDVQRGAGPQGGVEAL